jgi:hypothetical protein
MTTYQMSLISPDPALWTVPLSEEERGGPHGAARGALVQLQAPKKQEEPLIMRSSYRMLPRLQTFFLTGLGHLL